ncbi:MAG: hypothetical protein AAF996_09225 [Pseudomonadota bacterium]
MITFHKMTVVCILLIAACATETEPAPAAPTQQVTDSIAPSLDLLSAARAAGEQCLVNMDLRFQKYTCPVQPSSFDRDACMAFDDAIQSALAPIRACRQGGHFSEDTASSDACTAYLDAFFQPCVGAHALQLAYDDRAKSRSFKAALERGMDEGDARERYLSDAVRLRD